MRISRLTAALPAALLCAGALQAQEAAEETIEEIVVTAAPLGDVLQPTSVFKGAELFTDRAPTLGETLARQPGVSSSYFGRHRPVPSSAAWAVPRSSCSPTASRRWMRRTSARTMP